MATVSDRATRYGMILLDTEPTILRSRGEPIVFRSPEETLEYARIHGIQRWMVYGDREGWWPIYTQAGPVRAPRQPRSGLTSAGTASRCLARARGELTCSAESWPSPCRSRFPTGPRRAPGHLTGPIAQGDGGAGGELTGSRAFRTTKSPWQTFRPRFARGSL